MSSTSSFVSEFNLNDQAGVTAVLAAIRASTLSAADKNALRDLVFAYTNGGRDASVLIALEQKLVAYEIKPVVTQSTRANSPALTFGSYRPVPSFKAPAVSVIRPADIERKETPPATPVVKIEESAIPIKKEQPTIQYQEPTPVASNPSPQPTVSEPVVATAVSKTDQNLEVKPSSPKIAPPVNLESNQVALTDESAYLNRIKQIKLAVNSKVGNPVNLVDIDNEVGREYMNALLEAMKKLGSGAISEMAPAMRRLEAAFAAVELAIEKHGLKTKTEAVETVTGREVEKTVNPAEELIVDNTPPQTATEPPVVPLPKTPPVTRAETPVPVSAPMPTPTPAPSRVLPKTPIPPTPTPPTSTPTKPLAPRAERSGFVNAGVDTSESVTVAKIPPTPRAPVAPSLASEQPLKTPLNLTDPASIATSATGDPLYTKEVDDGLNQLLSDWSLFKKSGLFGTGPKGIEHPLFKKIADLQIPLLLAGRFDGATQEIRQSITDYMNGWRYEQGIIYQPGETFEKYLRRVIRHIIDLQKKRNV